MPPYSSESRKKTRLRPVAEEPGGRFGSCSAWGQMA